MVSLPGKGPHWWDRDVDDEGIPLRADVRQAAHQVWPEACRHVRSLLGESAEAAELMEGAVVYISHYLDRNTVPPFSGHVPSLLNLHFWQELRRRSARLRRFRSVGSNGFEGLATAADWVDAVNRQLDFERLLPHLGQRSRRIIAMRGLGYGWNEIGRRLRIAASTARNGFWLEIRRAQAKLGLNFGTHAALCAGKGKRHR